MTLKGTPLSQHIGYEVVGVDVRALNDEALSALRELWSQHLLLVFRGQSLSAEEQTEFSARLGRVRSSPSASSDASVEERYTAVIGNRSLNGLQPVLPEGEMWFHYDQMYREKPAAAAILYAVEVPSEGGNTLFSSGVAAFAALSAARQQELMSYRAEHIYDYRATTRKVDIGDDDAMRWEHPLVVEHPVTHRASLFVSRLMTSRVLDMPPSRSEALLESLFCQVEDPQFGYEHTWQAGDLLLWDNTSALHARKNFPADQARILRRTSLERDDALHSPRRRTELPAAI